MNTPHEVGATVRGHRKRLGMSQTDLGARAGLSVASVKVLEAGRANPTLDSLLRVTAALGLVLSAQPAPNEPPNRNLPRSATSRKRAHALTQRHAAEKEAADELASRAAVDRTVTPDGQVAKKKKQATNVTRDREPFDLVAHLESHTWRQSEPHDLEPDVEMDPDPGDNTEIDPEPTTNQLRKAGFDA